MVAAVEPAIMCERGSLCMSIRRNDEVDGGGSTMHHDEERGSIVAWGIKKARTKGVECI